MILNWEKNRVALWLTGSDVSPPSYFMLGSGSGTVVATQTELINPWDRQITTEIDDSITYKVKYIGDWNSVELSGTQLREWGVTISGTGTTGSMWSRTTMLSPINFDGTAELRIEETHEIF
jgi:hypothetical protein